MAKSALIIGGTGQIGWAASERLLAAGWDVTVASRSQREAADGARRVILDRENTDELLRLASGRDLVLDTVAYSADHGRQLASLAGRLGSLVVISTVSVYEGTNGGYLDIATGPADFPIYPQPVTEDYPTIDNDEQTYSPKKAAMERVLFATPNLPVSIIRPGAIHGAHSPFLREWYFIKRALDRRERVVLAYDGESRFNPIATANIAELVRLCAEQPGIRALNAVDDEHPTVRQIGETIFGLMEHSAEFITFPGEPRDGMGDSPWAIPRPFTMSMDKARRELGYEPVVTYAQGVEGDIRWMLDAVGRAEQRGQSWQEAFPLMIERYGAGEWFSYAAEDEFAASTTARAAE